MYLDEFADLAGRGSVCRGGPLKMTQADSINVQVDGPLVFNVTPLMLKAALAGFGLACLFEDQVQTHLADGRLVRVLADWCPPFPGYHLYYPSRRQPTPAFALLVEAMRYRA